MTTTHALSVRSIFIGLCLLAFSLSSKAEQVKQFDNYLVHYNAFNSGMLEPKVAQHYGIVRSATRGVINIAVQRNDSGKADAAMGIPTTAIVKAKAHNLVGQQKGELQFREVKEGDAIYYISDFRFSNEETFTFDVSIQPDPNSAPYTFSFRQKFYKDL